MKHEINGHTVDSLHIGRIELEASHWPDENGGPVHGALVIRTGCASLFAGATPADLRALALMLVDMADSLHRAQVQRETLTTC